MHFLPKANPLYEKISAAKMVIPDVLGKLGNGGFTGYLSHTAVGFEAYCIFAKGKLICAVSSRSNTDKTGFEAITLMFDTVFSSGGEINVYRMTADLAMCSHALVLGARLFNGDEVRQVDIKAMMVRLKGQGFNGVVHFYTPQRYGMMFYKDGLPIGFYHDGANSIESSPEESRKVASLAGARVNVCSTKPIEELMHYDLLQMVNLSKLWESAQSRHTSSRQAEQTATTHVVPDKNDKKLAELLEDIIEVASAYLSKEGRGVIEKAIRIAGGSSMLLDAAKTETFLQRIEADARTIDNNARIEEMIDLMRSEIAGRLAV
jgi:hypothetical protein